MRQHKKGGLASLGKAIWRQKTLYLMLFPAILFTVVFAYIPIWGIFTSFYNYNPGLGFSGSEFVGLAHFQRFFTDKSVFMVLRNTVAISFLNIAFGTISAIVFAILLNELVFVRFKKTVQTLSYLPHFVSFVVVANIAQTILATKGPLNDLLISMGAVEKPVVFFTIPNAFWWLVTALNIWKEMGWSAIIYIAAIAGIDPSLYEAAMVDGAGRLRRIWHITLPGIRPTIVVLLVLAVPDLLNAGFDASYLLGNGMVADFSEVLDTYIFRVGLQQGQYSYAAAIGLLRQVVGLVLILSANAFSRKVGEYSLF
jgi:putative aldouronate transport system permease protein